jgi:hypothetical protein
MFAIHRETSDYKKVYLLFLRYTWVWMCATFKNGYPGPLNSSSAGHREPNRIWIFLRFPAWHQVRRIKKLIIHFSDERKEGTLANS